MSETDLLIKKTPDEEDDEKCCTKKRAIRIMVAIIGILGGLAAGAAVLVPKVIPQVTKFRAIGTLEGISKDTKKVLRQSTPYVSVIAAALGPNIRNAQPFTNADIRTEDVDLGWMASDAGAYGWTPKEIVNEDSESPDLNKTLFVQQVKLTDSFSYEIIPRDDIFGRDAETAETGEFLRNERFLPVKDNINYFDNDEERDAVVADLGLLPKGLANGYLLPVPPHEWEEQISDEAISRIFWYGIGAVLIAGPESKEIYEGDKLVGFEINIDISSLEVRKGFHPYGFRITFDLDQKVTSIYDPASDKLFLPDDSEAWIRAKFWVKNTAITVITAREHLQWSHLIASNSLARAKIINLPPNHPIRRLLSIFTFNTNNVNANAQEILTPEQGYVHRMTAFTYPSLLGVFEYGHQVCNIFQPFRDIPVSAGVKELAENGKFPYYTEGVAYYMVVHKFVSEWLAEAGSGASDEYALAFYEELVRSSKGTAYEVPPYSADNMVDVIAQLIWVVTAYHEIVGTVVGYTQLPEFMPFRAAEKGEPVGDTETFLLAAYLTGLTGFRMPFLMREFPNFIGVGEGIPAWEASVWANFQAGLAAQSAAVQAADAERIAAGQPEFKVLDPARFECAISV